MQAPEGWSIEDGGKALIRSFRFKDFSEAFAFLTRVALHATQVEIDEWKARIANGGPYIDDYNRILSRANSFRSSPTGAWAGQITDSCSSGNPSGSGL
jgi:hypothetical protein